VWVLRNKGKMLKLGEFEIHCIVENRFHLDAGSVYGIVPKTIWSKIQQADENNLLPFDINVFLVKAHGKYILLDSGLGDFLQDKQRKLYGTEKPSELVPGLARLGIRPEQIDYVILSHLHWDHVGGCLKQVDGKPEVVFPRARHVIHADEWEDANHPDERTTGVYFPNRLKAISEAGLLELIDGEREILPGVKALRIGGHTRGQLGAEVESQGEKLIYYADNFLSCHHLKIPYVSATDLFPLETQRCKRETLPKIIEGGWYVAMDHDLDYKITRVKFDGLKYICEKVEV
jgi:glyoxylase-like metal-dependent hydrolase (beta-lactamase superfamily II)